MRVVIKVMRLTFTEKLKAHCVSPARVQVLPDVLSTSHDIIILML